MGYFTDLELQKFFDAVVTSGIDYGSARPALIAHIDPYWTGTILSSDSSLSPIMKLNVDLAKLNETERLVDGTVPLQIWMRNALLFTKSIPQGKVFQLGLGRIDASRGWLSSRRSRPSAGEKGSHRRPRRHVAFLFLQAGAKAGSSVARLKVPRFIDGKPQQTDSGTAINYLGTGWVIGPELIITNHHVVSARNENDSPATIDDLKLQASKTIAQFDYDEEGIAGDEENAVSLEAWDATLDYAILRVPGLKRTPLPRVERPTAKS